MSSSILFTGCATALVTPFSKDGSIDHDALRKLIRFQLRSGIDAIVLLGTTGEPCTLSLKERETVIETGLKEINGTVPLIIGTGSNDTNKSISFAKQAKYLGAQGQLCVTPYYNKPTQNGLIRHYETILSHCSFPMILYNVPARTGVHVDPDTTAMLSAHPDIAGIKEASGNISQVLKLLSKTHGNLPVYCGNDDMILPMMSIGAKGAISVCSNILPVQIRAITDACLNNQYAYARELQLSLYPIIESLFEQVNPIPVKYVLSHMGLIQNELRLPLVPLEEPYQLKLESLLHDFCSPIIQFDASMM